LGQAFHVSSVTGVPGEKVTLDITLDSAAGRAPTMLKWDVVFPAQLLELEDDGLEIGGAAMDSGKSIQCMARKPYSYACVLSGGQNLLANGTIAILRFKIRTTAEIGTAAVRIERVRSTTADSKELTLDNAEGTVTIRQR
jgi:hypothetical protein